MPESGSRSPRAHALAALALMQRFSTELDVIASSTLTHEGSVPNVDIEVLSALHGAEVLSPTELAEAVGLPRSTTSRAIARLATHGLLERRQRDDDGRRADLALTLAGRAQVKRFSAALTDFFVAGRATVKEVMLVLGHDPERAHPGPGINALELTALLSGAGADFIAEVTPAVRPFGITAAVERFAVVLVAERGQVRPFQLADELLLTPPGISSLLDRLEAADLVTRQQGVVVDDGRGVMVQLTPQGSRAAQAIVKVFQRHAERLLDALSRTLDIQ